MATFIEVVSPGDCHSFVKVSSIERLELPAGLHAGDLATPDAPILLFLRDGCVMASFSKSALQLLTAMLHENSPCVFVDPVYEADG